MAKTIENTEWHAILDALSMAPESTPEQVVDKIQRYLHILDNVGGAIDKYKVMQEKP